MARPRPVSLAAASCTEPGRGSAPSAVTGALGAAPRGLSDAWSPKVTALRGNWVTEPGVCLTDLNPGRGCSGVAGKLKPIFR